MTIGISTALATAAAGALAQALAGGCIEIYSGAQPATPDAAVTGTLLARVEPGSMTWVEGTPATGLTLQAAGRYLLKPADKDWRLRGITAGTASWWRFRGSTADMGLANNTLPRIDGAVGLAGDVAASLYLESTAITTDTDTAITYWWFAFPPI